MKRPALMLVSARASAALRYEVDRHERPATEFLELERRGIVKLLDWSALGWDHGGRSPLRSLWHAAIAASELDDCDVVFSDGEPVGIPLALIKQALGLSTPHLTIGHRLTRRAKRPFFTLLHAQRGMNRIIVHSQRQLEAAQRDLNIERDRLVLAPYGVDVDFWRPADVQEERLVLAVGREHRDYRTMAAALGDVAVDVFVTGSSAHSSRAVCAEPEKWPHNFATGQLSYTELRALYRRASIVIVPILPTDYQAGVTALFEAMAMGKAVVVTRTEGLADSVSDGVDALLVPPGDPRSMRAAVVRLLEDPEKRDRLGRHARGKAETIYSLGRFCDCIESELERLAAFGPEPVSAAAGSLR